ncbi:hypothetical protein K435DRAFT_210977 [Dendrothele bispora CBS 962.96]|uniref:Uncharacterized protein n=1 Tax=Dendrothele bispora (strain CBS 962.96) TaxID=1314807 RepID=A0A4V4HEU2_DENBC|nr:hypothetical protein K435DRAFT_210977 [Dendrothele bispora CBS 962.96]
MFITRYAIGLYFPLLVRELTIVCHSLLGEESFFCSILGLTLVFAAPPPHVCISIWLLFYCHVTSRFVPAIFDLKRKSRPRLRDVACFRLAISAGFEIGFVICR